MAMVTQPVLGPIPRMRLGTHQGAIGRQHLQVYLDEFVFRFNRWGSRSRGLPFYRLLQQAVAHPPISKIRINRSPAEP
jgi:hypothetical protein